MRTAIAVIVGLLALGVIARAVIAQRRAEQPGSEQARVPWHQDRSVIVSPAEFGYRVFTTDHDEVVEAERVLPEMRRAQLAQIIERRLAKSSPSSASVDLQSAAVELADLLRSAVSNRRTSVAILVDNSGSLRTRGIAWNDQEPLASDSAAMQSATTAILIGDALDLLGVDFQVLGFTTREWQGGQSRRDWLAKGSPPHPGRLNDLRHIIYKAADASWPIKRLNLGIMLDAQVLKENIDGEALIWAHGRLITRPASRRILIVISDGASVDDSTILANSTMLLYRHLEHVVEELTRRGQVHLRAIAIAHDPSRKSDVEEFYGNTLAITQETAWSSEVLTSIAQLFSPLQSQQ